MAKLITTPIGSFTQAAVTTINANMDAIEAAIENTLSRDGTTPNQMTADIDLNNNDLLNVNTLDVDSITLAGELLIPSDISAGTALEILTALKTVDGAGSGLDADLLDGQHAAAFVEFADTSTAAMNFVIDEDTMVSNLDTKVPTQQSVKAFVQTAGTVTATGGSTGRTLPSHFNDILGVKDIGAVGDSVTNDNAAFQAASTAGGVWNVPTGNYLISPAVSFGSQTFWQGGKILNNTGNAPPILPGVMETWFNDQKFFYEPLARPDTFATVRINRDADYTGGTPGNVASGLKVFQTTSAGVADFQWSILGSINNSATGGENVGVYGQGHKQIGAGPTWGMVSEVSDFSTANPTSGTVSIEAGIFVNGTDANKVRVGVHIPLHRRDAGGASAVAERGLWINPNANSTYTKGIEFSGAGGVVTGISFDNVITRAINFDAASTVTIGIDFSAATLGTAAIRLNRSQKVDLEATGTLNFTVPTATNIFALRNGTTETVGFDITGANIRISGTKVIDARKTGWAVDTGTSKRTANATYSGTAEAAYTQATIQTLMNAVRDATQTIKALKDDLHSTAGHGLIGT